MEQPNVSIYDMLIKHHRQQLKEDCPDQVKVGEEEKQTKAKIPSNNRRAERAHRNARDSSNKMPKFRLSRPRAMVDAGPVSNMATNVVTATHLTGNQSKIVLNTNTNKDVLNQLVNKMTVLGHKQPGRAAAGAAPAVAASPVAVKNRQRMATQVVSNTSNSINVKPRQALSPRNPNRQPKKTAAAAAAAVPAKGLRRVKSKSSNELKLQRRPKTTLAVAPKDSRQQNPTKVLVKAGPSVDIQRYRL